MIQAYQALTIVLHFRPVFHFDLAKIHQTMEEMEVIQEEIQMKMAMKPQELIKTYKVNDPINHLAIQSPVVMMEVEDVEVDTRLLLRSTNGRSRYQSWISLPEFIFRRRVR